jgi:hypothetical protein
MIHYKGKEFCLLQLHMIDIFDKLGFFSRTGVAQSV